ncbi:MAG: hypothetical protein GY758_24175, partial [Fuerstiella sp.]|nr:hypothetical protein [Fuerstiella sp.]
NDVVNWRRKSSRTESELQLTPLSVTGNPGWERGQIFGMPLGAAAITFRLKDGILRTEPVHCTVGTGHIDVMAQWDLKRSEVQLAPGSRIQNMEFSRELCRQWMGYIAPMLTDATAVDGKLSVRLQRLRYFTDHPYQSEIMGKISIHHVSASAGESILPFFQVLERISKRSLADRHVELPPQDVEVRMSDGFVEHDGLQMDVANNLVSSSGKVGLNQAVDLELQIPPERSTAHGQGRTLTIPVHGTITSPRINISGLIWDVGSREMENRASQQIDRGLNRLLNGLR